MAENFDLIFGQSASQQYAWSDSDYQNGWQTVGSTPPTAEQFDALQRRSDTKAKDLNERLEPLETKAEADGRQAATAYTAGAMLTVDGLPNGWLLECIVPGISGTDAITLPDTLIDGFTIIDGDVTWALRKVATNGGLGYRQPNETVSKGTIRYHQSLPVGYYLECTTPGITDSGDITPSSTIGATVSDGEVTWTVNQGVSTLGGATLVGNVFKKTTDDSYLLISGGNTSGATLLLNGGNRGGDNAGIMEIYAISNNTSSALRIFPDGGLVHQPISGQSANDLAGSAIVAKSFGANGYVKYASGLIVQWGQLSGTSPQSATKKEYSITLPISFATRMTAISLITVDSPEGYATGRNITHRLCLSPLKAEITVPSNTNLGFAAYFFAIGY